MTSINSIKSLILDLPPSCIEFCPTAPEFFVVGTYFLEKKEGSSNAGRNVDDGGKEEKEEEDEDEDADEDEDEDAEVEEKIPQKRTGSLVLFRVDGDDVIEIQTLTTPHAILDLHFSPHDPTLFAIATSTGSLVLYRLNPLTSSLTQVSLHQMFPRSTLVLSLCWHPIHASKIGVTLSTGEVHICDIPYSSSSTTNNESHTEADEALLTHDLEAWTLTFSPNGHHTFSGGDDATLRFHDAETCMSWSDRRVHSAGVTAILPLGKEDDVTVTGSYDDNIRVLHTPKMGRRSVLAECNLEGGVWRLRVLDEEVDVGSHRYTILASCMHAGTRIVTLTKDQDNNWDIQVLAKFEEHKSMNYGSDVQPLVSSGQTERPSQRNIVSTSFYDKLLCLWRW